MPPLLTLLSQKSHVQTSRNFLYMLNVAVASRLYTTRYVLPVLWMTSCFHTVGRAKSTPIGCIFKMTHRGGAEPGSKSDVYYNLVYYFRQTSNEV